MVKTSPGAADTAVEEELILSGSEEGALAAPGTEAAPVSDAAAVRENMARLRKIGHVPWKKDFKTNWVIYCLFLPVLVWLILFHYLPIGFSIPLAFKDYKDYLGIFESPWNGWENFRYLFTGGGVGGSEFLLALRNTFAIGGLNLTIGFIVPSSSHCSSRSFASRSTSASARCSRICPTSSHPSSSSRSCRTCSIVTARSR